MSNTKAEGVIASVTNVSLLTNLWISFSSFGKSQKRYFYFALRANENENIYILVVVVSVYRYHIDPI